MLATHHGSTTAAIREPCRYRASPVHRASLCAHGIVAAGSASDVAGLLPPEDPSGLPSGADSTGVHRREMTGPQRAVGATVCAVRSAHSSRRGATKYGT